MSGEVEERYDKLNGHGDTLSIVLRERRDEYGYYLDRYYKGEWLDAFYPYFRLFTTGDIDLREIDENEANAIIAAGNALGPDPDELGKQKEGRTR